MSYILEALKKADRQRHGVRVPSIETVHASAPARTRRLWPWVVAAALAGNAAVLAVIWWPTTGPVVIASSPESSPSPTPPPPVAAATERPVEPPPAPSAPAESRTPLPPAAPAPPASRAASVTTPAPATPPATTAPSRRAASDGADSAEKARRAPVAARVEPPPVEKPQARVEPASGRPAASGVMPSFQDLPQASKESIGNIRLQVLVYSENNAERMVFINSRKYVEGQQVDGKLVVESITRDGAVLSYQGRRFLLRQ